jgi:transcriptional regulator with XRE-family HTH domain
MSLNSRETILKRLRRGKRYRIQFVESHLSKTIAYQIRATRDKLGWSQSDLAAHAGMTQNGISRLESPDYGKYTISTLKKLAAALDVALIVRLIPFSELADWVSGTPRINRGLTAQSLAIANFESEETAGVFERSETLSLAPHSKPIFVRSRIAIQKQEYYGGPLAQAFISPAAQGFSFKGLAALRAVRRTRRRPMFRRRRGRNNRRQV